MHFNSSLKLNSKITLKNRVIVPPMASQTADQMGYVTQNTIDHYVRLTKSNAAMVMVEYTYIHPSGRSEENQLGIDSDDHIKGLHILRERIEQQGTIAAIQLTHAGAKSNRNLTRGVLISPSGIAVPIKGEELEIPDKATQEEIDLLKNAFFAAAKRATSAGFKVIELHSAHGYGLNQWISPITNQRADRYGGHNNGRFLILLEIVKMIKEHLPQVVLSVRIPGMDHAPNGLTYQDTTNLATELELAGVDIINVSSGIGGWRRPGSRSGEGYLVEDAAIINRYVNIPVIGVGGIKSTEYINQSLTQSCFTLAAVGRAILNDPLWGPRNGL